MRPAGAYITVRAQPEAHGWAWEWACRLCGHSLQLAPVPNGWATTLALGQAHLIHAHTPRHLDTYGEAGTYLT
ncbi:hypothetical protein [Kocuria sp. TGY1127_2]|uniref:hypothetical protein n=1 Tax=Kocuria sp. TGY1127_2 TaxID=2711328 RepID=UPI0015BDE362|nr:hypothetical protein [Kocuria sp. TGY1127_2]